MAGQAAAQPFSMHARGVHTYETSPLLDFSYQFRVMLRELRCGTPSWHHEGIAWLCQYPFTD